MKKIMIIDDDASIRDTLELLMEMEEYEVVTAENGKVALTWLDQHPPPDLILLDLMMPVMNGWEFFETFSKRPEFRGIPVIVLSAYMDRGAIPATGYALAKPLDIDQLCSLIRELTQKRQRHG